MIQRKLSKQLFQPTSMMLLTSLMWVEKVVLTVFFESLLGTPVVLFTLQSF